MSRLILAAEIGYKDVTVSPATSSTLYIGSEGFVTDHTDTLPDTYFAGRMDGDVSYSLRLSTAFWGSKSSIGIGSVEIINDDGELDTWLDYEFRDQAIVLKQHTAGASYDSATVILNAIIERLDVVSEKRLRIVIRDPAAALVVPMITEVFAGNDAAGVLKPIAFGQPELCKPVLVDEDNLEYHVNDTTLKAIDAVYDQGVAVDFNPVANGFRLIQSPAGKVTATVISSGTGSDPVLTLSATEYLVSGEGRSIQMFIDGLSPEVSLDYATADAVDASRASADGGKYYFEMYVDSLNEPSSTLSPATWGGVAFDIAAGIASAAISNPQPPKAAGFYMLSVGAQYAGGSIGTEYNNYTNNTLADSHDVIPRNSVGDTIGVLVDFDAMTIEYRRNNVNDDAVFDARSIAAGTYSPVVTASDKNKDAIASIRLVEDDFVYSLPAGYSAWSAGIVADSTFSKFTESITDRLTGVTFDSASVTAIDALAHSSPEVTYTYSYYLDKSYTASKLLTDCLASIGGYWYINRLGEVEVGQLTAPGTSVRTITDVEITGDISIMPDYAKGLSNGIGSLRNWSPYRDSEVGGSATEVWKQQITRDYQVEYRSSNVMASGYDHAIGADLPMNLLIDSTAAQTECDRLTALYATEPKFYKVPIAMNTVDFDNAIDEIGSTYTIQSDRFNLDNGADLVLVGVDGSFLDNTMMLTLWGNVPPLPAINDPTEISGLITWLDASDMGGSATVWQDKSGLGNDWTAGAANQLPVYQAGDDSALFQSVPAQTFVSGPDIMSGLSEAEMFIKLKSNDSNVAAFYFTTTSPTSMLYPWSTDDKVYFGWGSSFWSGTAGAASAAYSYHTLNVYSAHNDWAAFHDGALIASSASSTVSFSTAPMIGNHPTDGGYRGNIKAVVIFNRKLTATERTNMNEYMDAL